MNENREEEIDLRDCFRVIIRRRWTIITVFAVIVLIVSIKTFTTAPIYKTTTSLIIDRENPNVVSIQEVMTVDASAEYYQTQYKIILSRSVAREVIRRLQLAESEEFFPKPKDDFMSNLKRSLKNTISSWKETVVSLFNNKQVAESPEDQKSESTLISRLSAG